MRGSCCCGNIAFTVNAAPTGASACHCRQCRKMSGHIWASAQVPQDQIIIAGPVTWFHASPRARRGICPTCGAFLFWQGTGETMISFALGAIDGPTGLALEKHIFTSDRGDYYTLSDGLPQKD
ncbi:GFA family protein [Puniceibacterium sp. IMCC21224]|uniref:GFA family protein n=1 Tax=Puniceibacterium sp. IMCC21224 TaxID=1618204 RepID=UPI00064D84FE|nr:GFA family protein [Puniceibacterium sp. IMCC21224]KMK68720.1 hypothetical protein IMCC21224_113605 [Puniceibacterium sp. IMCC21224]